METFLWVLGGGVAMSAIALVGSIALVLPEPALRKLLLPLVAFASGSLLGGAFFHMLPEAIDKAATLPAFVWLLGGFAVFMILEQFLHWHHCHRAGAACRQPRTYLILIGDGLHNFMGGLAVAGAFIIDIRLGMVTWLAAAAHEVPQELGDFAVLVHGGWPKGRALLFNVLSGLTFLVGSLVAWLASFRIDTTFLLPFAAGNFLYIAASDLVPEVNKDHGARLNLVHTACFLAGMGLLWGLRVAFA